MFLVLCVAVSSQPETGCWEHVVSLIIALTKDSGVGKPSEIRHTPADVRTDKTVYRGSVELATDKRINQNVHAGTFMLTQEMTMPETYIVAVTYPTGWPAGGRPVQIVEDPCL